MSDNLWVEESYTNATKGYLFGDSEPYETFTDNLGRLYKSMQKEYGRCVSKVYIDTPEGSKPVGWVFQGRQKYENARSNTPEDYYIREVWVTVYKSQPVKHVTWDRDYADMGKAR